MPLQNRVTPLGELVAVPERGLVYGNRGCLHDGQGRIRRSHAGRRWIACRLRYKDWHRAPLLQPGKFTELFFLDEATAFAAGHRPCALCRREDYVRFGELWPWQTGADAIDERLHVERLEGKGRRLHEVDLDELPNGAFVLSDGRAVARPRRRAPELVSRRLPGTGAQAARARDAAHAALPRRGAAGGLARRGAVPPPVGRGHRPPDLVLKQH